VSTQGLHDDASASSTSSHFESNAADVKEIRTCLNHGRATVNYRGPACPFCLVLDDLDFTRRDLERAMQELTARREE
jgi:hypothetical protein